MRSLKSSLRIAVALLMVSASTAAQTTTGTITGRVLDGQSLGVPGVTVTVESPNRQGILTVVTSENGDYIVPLLPPGTYTLTFQLSGFEPQEKTANVAPTQTVPLNVVIGPAALSQTVNVVGRAADVLTQTAQVATNFKQDMIATLPTNRDINATVLRAPSVHPSGPGGAYSIAGAMSFESLYMVNGVTINENLRGQPNTLYIEDAIQETTVATDGISAEFGRFSGGVVNVITRSGGNLFSGSFRDSLNNDNWRSLVTGNAAHPFPPAGTTAPADTTANTIVPEYEGVFGGPIVKNQLSFFSAVRVQNQTSELQTVALNLPYAAEDNSKRFEGKVTYSLNSNNRFEGDYIKVAETQVNSTFSTATSMDLASLYTRELPQDLFTINYNGILSSRFFLEGRFSDRLFSFIGTGAQSRDLIGGTLLLDRQRGNLRYWSPTFCGVCDPEKRDNNDAFLKGTYFKSTKGAGSHNMTFGFDTFDDERFANNHQSGSDYRIYGTTTIIRDGVIYPQWLPGSTFLMYDPITTGSLGNQFRTNSLFYNDNWRYNSRVTLNLGARWDMNHGTDSAGNLVANDSGFSPRVGVVWDPKGDGAWSVSASVAKYVDAINNSIADSSSAAGNPSVYEWFYQGPAINPSASAATLVAPPSAIQQVFNGCQPNAQGLCTTSAPFAAAASGVSTKIPNGLSSPYVLAYAVGVSRQFGNRGVVRADYSYRDYRDFYSQRIDTSTGAVTDPLGGQKDDLAIVENTNALTRRYSGVTVSTTYRASARTDIGGNYTLSRLWGNFDGENSSTGPLTTDVFQYPEYKQMSWNAPEGDLSADQRHRVSMWINYGVPRLTGLTLSLLQDLASGLPYGAVGSVDPTSFVTNPGYITPPTSVNYYFTARDAFRTDWSRRTDFAASYARSVKTGTRRLELFTQAQVLNLFDQQDLCACGANVFSNGGAVSLTSIGQSVLTAANTASLAPFNPMTTKPVLGTNWSYGANFGTPLNRFAFTSPRTFRMTFGVRF